MRGPGYDWPPVSCGPRVKDKASCKLLKQFFQCTGYSVKQFVHQLRLLHLGDENHYSLSFPRHPTGLGMCAPAARQYKDTGVSPIQSLKICSELAFCQRVAESLLIITERPVHGIFINVCPSESLSAMRRIAEVVYFMSRSDKTGYHIRIKRIPPTGCNVDPGHMQIVSLQLI